MQLEKVTARSGEAGLAGWISSNDVTLFTVVLVISVAIFLQSNLTKRSKKNRELQAANLSLSDQNLHSQEEIAQISAEIEDVNAALVDARGQLRRANEDLETTRRNLNEKTRSLQKVTQQLQDTKTELTTTREQQAALEQQLGSTREAVKDLNERLAALEIQKGDLMKQKESLTAEKTQVDQDLAKLADQLKTKLQQLDDLQRERDLLDQQAKALTDRVARLESQLGDTQQDLTAMQQTSQSEMENLKQLLARALQRNKQDQAASTEKLSAAVSRAEEASQQATEATARADDYLSRLRRAAAYFKQMDENKKLLQLEVQALKTQLANALDDLKASEQQLVRQRSREKTINRELVGLRGDLRRVAILFDSSGSMNESGRWEEVQRIASTWLDYLEVDECVLIVFASQANAFPSDGSMIRVSGAEGDANRVRLSEHLRAVEPEGWTNTLAAMRLAYSYEDLDTIILFSDGAPTLANSGTFDERSAQQIYSLCRQNADIPVNAIGLGNYFDQELSTFLRTVASLTGGTFVGR
jgi:chromosome segregation ATPase